MSIIIEIPFSTSVIDEAPDSGLIPFDPNFDMTMSCFVCYSAMMILNNAPSASIVESSIGAAQPVDVNTEAFALRWSFSADPTCNLIIGYTKMLDVYLADGYSGWSVSTIDNVSGRIVLFGEIVPCSEVTMAQVTFDYSSLISVASGAVVKARKAVVAGEGF